MQQKHKHIYFDLDSTLCSIESFDEIASWEGIGKKVKVLTAKSMDGVLPLDEVLASKVTLIAPNQKDVDRLSDLYLANITPGMEELIARLKADNWTIGIVTGNLELATHKLAAELGIETENIYANQIELDEAGEFVSFSADQPLVKEGGKYNTLAQIRKHHNPDQLIFIGDSYGDFRAHPVVDKFIGFGGVVSREKVVAEAKYFAKSVEEIRDALQV